MKKILIVDDDNFNCVLTKHVLEGDYQVIVTNSGKGALTLLENEIPDLILMDLEMPMMNGKEVVRLIKECEKWSDIPVIFLTADSDPMTEAECLKCGAEDFITKPFVPVVMKSRISKILEAHETRKDLELQLEKKTIKSVTDALTGLHNRYYLEQELQALLDNGNGGTLFMIDLDNFKTLNDTYGHSAGDVILQNFAKILKKYAREGDLVCRLGGDEFVAFYINLTDKDVVAKKAESIIRGFAERVALIGYGGVVSVSIGAKITKGEETFQELYDIADKSLYFAKNNGKNCYNIYNECVGECNHQPKEIYTNVNLQQIHNIMVGKEKNTGAFHIDYNEFKKMYDFARRCVIRKKQKVQILLFTLEMSGSQQNQISMDVAMDILISSVISSLRNVDTGTQYNSSQYVLILMDTDIENGKGVANRVISKFNENPQIAMSDVVVDFDIQTMTP